MSGKGFHDDCMDLIATFCERNSTNFQLFCDDWKEKGFHYVFHGYTFQHELLLSMENCFVILKNIFISSATLSERLGTLYLMYAMYYKQPTKDFCKYRFTLKDWTKMKNFYDSISSDRNYLQARAIFWRLWHAHAFRFVECDLEQYPETMSFHRLDNDGLGDFQRINSAIVSTVKNIQSETEGILGAIETLQSGYNEMKEHLNKNVTECSNLRSINVSESVHRQLNKIKKLFENKYDADVTNKSRRHKPIDGVSAAQNAIQDLETDFEMELAEMSSSFGESNDDIGSDTSSDMDSCLNIGSKRYYLKRKALQKSTGDLHRFKSSATTSNRVRNDRGGTSQGSTSDNGIVSNDSRYDTVGHPSHSRINESETNPIGDEMNETIVICHPKKVYNRTRKEYKNSVQKQVMDLPIEASAEIDARSPSKNTNRKTIRNNIKRKVKLQ